MADQSNEMGMIERVAVALYEAETSDLMDNWYSATVGLQDIYRRQARAAIEALKEPSNEMLRAFWKAEDPTDAGFRASWNAALDAALEVKG